MFVPKAATVALSLALLASRGLPAQVASRLEAGTLVTGRDGELPTSLLSVSPGIRVDLPLANISAHGTAWLNGQDWQVADGTVSGSLLSPIVLGALRGEVTGNASRALSARSLSDDQVDGQARVHVLFKQRGGLWVGGGLARPWRIAVVSSVDVAGGGAWTRLGGAMLSGTFTSFSFTKVAPARDTASGAVHCGARGDGMAIGAVAPRAGFTGTAGSGDCRLQSHFSDVESSVRWEHDWLELSAQTGYRLGDTYDVDPASRRWASVLATIWLRSRLALVAGGGSVPANPSRGLPARNYFHVGMMLAYWPIPRGTVPVALPAATVRSFDVRPAVARGMQKITVRVGGVESVEVMGDFSDWSALTLTRRGRDLWELTVPLERGVHQIMMRVDGGEWKRPPGHPPMPDGYGGEVGLLIVQ